MFIIVNDALIFVNKCNYFQAK